MLLDLNAILKCLSFKQLPMVIVSILEHAMCITQLHKYQSGNLLIIYITMHLFFSLLFSPSLLFRGSSTSCSGVRRKPASFYKWPYEPSRLYTVCYWSIALYLFSPLSLSLSLKSNLRSSTTAARASGLFVLIDSIIIFNVTMTVPFRYDYTH